MGLLPKQTFFSTEDPCLSTMPHVVPESIHLIMSNIDQKMVVKLAVIQGSVDFNVKCYHFYFL